MAPVQDRATAATADDVPDVPATRTTTSSLRRGGGVPSKADSVSHLSKGGCVNLRTEGEGVKKSEIFSDVTIVSPLNPKMFHLFTNSSICPICPDSAHNFDTW